MTRLGEAIAAREPVAMLTVIDAAGRPDLVGRHLLAGEAGLLFSEIADEGLLPGLANAASQALKSGRTGTVTCGPLRVYVEPYLPPPALVVVGAGHVAQQVAHLGKLVGFEVTVIDDRAEYANRARFPDADHVLCGEFVPTLLSLDPGPLHHVVLVTRGHRMDMECLHAVIDRPVAYIGMIGSRNRIQTVFRTLEEEHGVNPERLSRVYTPIGLDIGARTPAEIAVAALAELIKVRHGGTGESLSRLGRARIHEG